jgi:transposase
VAPNCYETDLNPTYQEIAEHYQVAVLPAWAVKHHDNGNVENGIQNVGRWILAPLRNKPYSVKLKPIGRSSRCWRGSTIDRWRKWENRPTGPSLSFAIRELRQ